MDHTVITSTFKYSTLNYKVKFAFGKIEGYLELFA